MVLIFAFAMEYGSGSSKAEKSFTKKMFRLAYLVILLFFGYHFIAILFS